MKFLKIFTLPEDWEHTSQTTRKACRGIVVDESNIMPLLFVGQDNYHKLPWWGIEWDEEKIEAFKREVGEETWCEVDNIQEIWRVIEKNSTWEQTSYCYIWKITKKWSEHYTPEEINKWYVLKWVSIKEALRIMKKDLPKTVGGKWRQQRDVYILQEINKIYP